MAFVFSSPHFDASETVFVQRQLEQVRAQTYDVKYPALKGRQFVPVDTSISPGAETVTYRQYTNVGMAIILSNYSQRLPRADVFVKEFTSRIRGIGNSYGFSIQEMRAAQYAGVPLEQRKANAARQAYELKFDQIVQTGDSTYGLLGFINQPNVSVYTVPNGVSGTATWATKTADEILADLNGIEQKIVDNTKEVEAPDTILLPPAQYALIHTKPRSSTSDTTIAEFFLKNSANVKQFATWSALKTAGSGGSDRMIAYRRSPDVLQAIEPQPFEQLAPQTEGLEIVTHCHGRSGGVVVYYPLAICFGDGI